MAIAKLKLAIAKLIAMKNIFDNQIGRKAFYYKKIEGIIDKAIPDHLRGFVCLGTIKDGCVNLVADNASVATSARFLCPLIVNSLNKVGFKEVTKVNIKTSPEYSTFQMNLLKESVIEEKNYPSEKSLILMRSHVDKMPKDELSLSLSNLIDKLSNH